MPAKLGEFEQLVLLALLRLGDAGYGVSVRRQLTKWPNDCGRLSSPTRTKFQKSCWSFIIQKRSAKSARSKKIF